MRRAPPMQWEWIWESNAGHARGPSRPGGANAAPQLSIPRKGFELQIGLAPTP